MGIWLSNVNGIHYESFKILQFRQRIINLTQLPQQLQLLPLQPLNIPYSLGAQLLTNRQQRKPNLLALILHHPILNLRFGQPQPLLPLKPTKTNGPLLQPIQLIQRPLKRHVAHEVEGVLLLLLLLFVLFEDEGLGAAEGVVDQADLLGVAEGQAFVLAAQLPGELLEVFEGALDLYG